MNALLIKSGAGFFGIMLYLLASLPTGCALTTASTFWANGANCSVSEADPVCCVVNWACGASVCGDAGVTSGWPDCDCGAAALGGSCAQDGVIQDGVIQDGVTHEIVTREFVPSEPAIQECVDAIAIGAALIRINAAIPDFISQLPSWVG